jgi:2-polyprenyl-6-methoxyphenol hydroxylase-like FAD-dependent oxidoreductase
LSRRENDPDQLLGNVNYGKVLILLNRGDYFQAGMLIRKGSFDQVQNLGLESFRESVRRIAPYLGDRVEELNDWNQIKLLSVQINRLLQWYKPGLLCIGDAAHAMSPAWGVGINLAIQDAIAAARLLAGPMKEGRVTEATLASVQQRREFPTRVTQQLQVLAHNQLTQLFRASGPAKAPWQFKLVVQIPGIQRLAGRMIGLGIRPEHVSSSRVSSCTAGRVRRTVVGVGVAVAVFAASLLGRSRPLHELRSV